MENKSEISNLVSGVTGDLFHTQFIFGIESQNHSGV